MKIQFGNEIIASYKRLSYKSWYAFAEFIDNSTQAYLNNKAALQSIFDANGESLTITIDYDSTNGSGNEVITIEDNSIGMNENDLERALIIGLPPDNINGRSKYGLGMKTAAFWFGDVWSIRTKKLGEQEECFIEINISDVVANKSDFILNKTSNGKIDEHYTIIKIAKLNRTLNHYIKSKCSEFLSSFYRHDFAAYNLNLIFLGKKLEWDEAGLIDRLIKNHHNVPYKENFEFEINGKLVKGWAGVFENGSRKDAGFSIIQADRVIKGWPDSYKPEKIYGFQEGGSNNLISQRLVGEIILEGFDVSHTKDAILFVDDEEDILQNELIQRIAHLLKLSREYRKVSSDENTPGDIELTSAVADMLSELNSDQFRYVIEQYETVPDDVIVESNKMVVDVVRAKTKPFISTSIGSLNVILYFNSDTSPYEPYLITKSTTTKDEVVIIINKLHPHWQELKSYDNIYNYIRHCVYDGVAEWKAWFLSNSMNPETIKNIKDQLLRIPFELEKTVIKDI